MAPTSNRRFEAYINEWRAKRNFKPEMAQALKDLEKNVTSEIQMKISTLEFEQENQDDKNVIKFLIIILTVIFVCCLVTLNMLALLTEGFGGGHT